MDGSQGDELVLTSGIKNLEEMDSSPVLKSDASSIIVEPIHVVEPAKAPANMHFSTKIDSMTS